MSASFWHRFEGWALGGFRPFGASRQSASPFLGARSSSGAVVTPEKALKLSVLWACVNLRCSTMSSLPLHLIGANKKAATDYPLYNVLHSSPNADMTASEYWEMMHASVDLWGNGYSRKMLDGRRVISLEPWRPEGVTPFRDNAGNLRYRYKNGETELDLPATEVFHLKGFTVDGLVGLSPLSYHADTIGAQIDANSAASTLFQNGLKAGGFMKTGPGTLTTEQRDKIKAALAEFGLPKNAGRWMVLEAGWEPVPLADSLRLSPHDAQLLESRVLGNEEICRAYAVPPVLVGIVDKASSWASSIENLNLGFLMYSLRQRLVRTEQAISKQLIPAEDRAKLRPKHNIEGLLRADSKSRAEFYNAGLNDGWLTRNEVRELEDREPLPGGDILTVQAQMVPLDELGKPIKPPKELAKSETVIVLGDGRAVAVPVEKFLPPPVADQ
jgi:HK97 family phage portal protein